MTIQLSDIGGAPFPVNWDALSVRLRAKFPHLADANLNFEQGGEEDLFTRLESLLNRRREDILNILNETGRKTVE
jgi:hypothetical protein